MLEPPHNVKAALRVHLAPLAAAEPAPGVAGGTSANQRRMLLLNTLSILPALPPDHALEDAELSALLARSVTRLHPVPCAAGLLLARGPAPGTRFLGRTARQLLGATGDVVDTARVANCERDPCPASAKDTQAPPAAPTTTAIPLPPSTPQRAPVVPAPAHLLSGGLPDFCPPLRGWLLAETPLPPLPLKAAPPPARPGRPVRRKSAPELGPCVLARRAAQACKDETECAAFSPARPAGMSACPESRAQSSVANVALGSAGPLPSHPP